MSSKACPTAAWNGHGVRSQGLESLLFLPSFKTARHVPDPAAYISMLAQRADPIGAAVTRALHMAVHQRLCDACKDMLSIRVPHHDGGVVHHFHEGLSVTSSSLVFTRTVSWASCVRYPARISFS
ncbi:hypothetical protein CVIRNUC_000573 [Coccomyxa viridis]|uniref:Uncharacterized protein n=1 Tax=Coccomyxa viridis TaxID=1274662 RepID=A0AAV1HQL7_9CHLO|nr:hypothetical protein CVIRNUC_000573 [Coccomyxa viridis]